MGRAAVVSAIDPIRRRVFSVFAACTLAGCGPKAISLDLPSELSVGPKILLYVLESGQAARAFVVDAESGEGLPSALVPELHEQPVELYAFGYDHDLDYSVGAAQPGVFPFAQTLRDDFRIARSLQVRDGESSGWAAPTSIPREVAGLELKTRSAADCPRTLNAVTNLRLQGDPNRGAMAALQIGPKEALVLGDGGKDDFHEFPGHYFLIRDDRIVSQGLMPEGVRAAMRLDDGRVIVGGDCAGLFEMSFDASDQPHLVRLTLTSTASCLTRRPVEDSAGWMAGTGTIDDFELFVLSRYGVFSRVHGSRDRAEREVLWLPPAPEYLELRGGLISPRRGVALAVTRSSDQILYYREGVQCDEQPVCLIPGPVPGQGFSTLATLEGFGTMAGGSGWVAVQSGSDPASLRPLSELDVPGVGDLRPEGFATTVNAFARLKSGFVLTANDGAMAVYVPDFGFCPFPGDSGHVARVLPHHVHWVMPWGDQLLVVSDDVPGPGAIPSIASILTVD